MNPPKTIHQYRYDALLDLSADSATQRCLKQLAYVPPAHALQGLSLAELQDWLVQQETQHESADLTRWFGQAASLPSSVLLLYGAHESSGIDPVAARLLAGLPTRLMNLFAGLEVRLLVFLPAQAPLIHAERVSCIRVPQTGLPDLFVRRHLEKVLENQPELHRSLLIKRGVLIDTGTYQARRVGHRFGEDYALALGEAVEYCIEHRGVNFELYAKLKADSDVLVVFGQSAVTKGANNTPVFHRWSWADDLPYSVLVLNDPTLYLDPQILGGWFQGTADHYYMETMAQIVGQFARQLSIPNPRILWFGSSAGGFSSMMMALTLRGSHALVQIPQVDMSRYSIQSSVDDLCTYCYGGLPIEDVMAQYGARMSVIEAFRAARYVPNIWYLQNTQDQNHLLRHYATFVEGIARLMIDLPEVRGADVLLELYDILNPVRGGHTVMNKPDTLAYIHRAVERFILQPAGQRAG